MSHFIVVSLVSSGIYLAFCTHQAGLRQFGWSIAATNIIGYAFVAFGFPTVGFPIAILSIGLILASRYVMKKHKIGPFSVPSQHKEP